MYERWYTKYKKEILLLKEETSRMHELLDRMAEQIGKMARKEKLMMLQRQFDVLRL